MSNRKASKTRLLLVDPDPARRARILAQLRGIPAIEAASMPEAFDLAESQMPNAVALAAELSGEHGLAMFLRLVDALSAAFVIYGDRSADRTPQGFKASISFVEVAPEGGPEAILDGLLGQVSARAADGPAQIPAKANRMAGAMPGLVVIGASTGGVSALEAVLTSFPPDCPATLVVQHIRAGFAEGMISRLDSRCAPRIVGARDGMPVEHGHVYVAADTGSHLVLTARGALRCHLRPDAPRHGHRPSVDVLFESAAPRGRAVSAALLTGMGADGAAGMRAIRAAGGRTIAQDEASCVVYGMPRVAVETGAAAMVLPLDRIADGLLGREAALPAQPSVGKELTR